MCITASHIVDWANTHAKEAQNEMPRLVRRLCFLAGSTRQLAFPADDSTYVPGWDGRLFSDQGNAWVPMGASCWEVGCDQGIGSKANRDFLKRTDETDESERRNTTFVFVTPRRWSRKSSWIKKQKNQNKWADVRAYDADDLEQWLEQSAAVALRFAEEIGLMGQGVESIERHWRIWSRQCNPPITRDAFFTDRVETRNSLLEQIGTKGWQRGQLLMLRADSVEEAAAFTAATLLEKPELADQALVVTEAAGWRFVETNPQLRVAIAARTEVAIQPTLRDGLLVIVPHVFGDLSDKTQDQERVLDTPSIHAFEKALVVMGMEASDATRYALSTGRSWSVLRRRRAINRAIRHPAWLDAAQATSLATVCLLGAWNTDKEVDRQVVSRVAARPYEEIESDLLHLAQLDDAPDEAGRFRVEGQVAAGTAGAVWPATDSEPIGSLLPGRARTPHHTRPAIGVAGRSTLCGPGIRHGPPALRPVVRFPVRCTHQAGSTRPRSAGPACAEHRRPRCRVDS